MAEGVLRKMGGDNYDTTGADRIVDEIPKESESTPVKNPVNVMPTRKANQLNG